MLPNHYFLLVDELLPGPSRNPEMSNLIPATLKIPHGFQSGGKIGMN
jgi:hypothetical protein